MDKLRLKISRDDAVKFMKDNFKSIVRNNFVYLEVSVPLEIKDANGNVVHLTGFVPAAHYGRFEGIKE